MIIGVISDTHIPVKADIIPKKILDAFKKVDMIIHAGDFINTDVLKELKKICPQVKGVRGNMDDEKIQAELSEKEIIKAGNFTIGVMHGCGAPANLINILKEAFKKDKVDVIVFGHSHTPCNEIKDGTLFFNPGSPTDTVFAPYNSYGILKVNDKIEGEIIRI